MRFDSPAMQEAAEWRRKALRGEITRETWLQWSDCLRNVSAEIEGARAILEAAPHARGSSAGYRADDLLEEATARVGEDADLHCTTLYRIFGHETKASFKAWMAELDAAKAANGNRDGKEAIAN